MRGEYSDFVTKKIPPQGSPPHARGILFCTLVMHKRTGITPACAGNTCPRSLQRCRPRDHPRMRGEYTFMDGGRSIPKGSPPHARGIPMPLHFVKALMGITPACAGNTSRRGYRTGRYRDHPRMRGEYFWARG